MLAVVANNVQAAPMASNPEEQAIEGYSEIPEPEDLPSHIENKLEPDRARASSLRASVDRSADTVRPPTASPKVAAQREPPSSDDGDVPSVPAAPRVPVI
jgi:hypothetical protein